MLLPFTPRYSHPFTFEALCELEVPIIAAEIPRLQNSISRLKDSNQQIHSHVESLADPDDAEEVQEMNNVIHENEETIKAQDERILLLKHALEAKMGFDPTNSHYGTVENRAVITQTTSNAATSNTSNPPAADSNNTEQTDEGLYL